VIPLTGPHQFAKHDDILETNDEIQLIYRRTNLTKADPSGKNYQGKPLIVTRGLTQTEVDILSKARNVFYIRGLATGESCMLDFQLDLLHKFTAQQLAKAKLSQIPFVIVPSVTKMLRSNITNQDTGKTNILAHFEIVGIIKMICPTADLTKIHKCFDFKSFTSGIRNSPQQIPFTVDGIPFSMSTAPIPDWIEAPKTIFRPIDNTVYRVPVEDTAKLQDIADLLMEDASLSIESMFDVVPSDTGQHVDMNYSQLVVIWKNGPVGEF